jgi:hypothetical protein
MRLDGNFFFDPCRSFGTPEIRRNDLGNGTRTFSLGFDR